MIFACNYMDHINMVSEMSLTLKSSADEATVKKLQQK